MHFNSQDLLCWIDRVLERKPTHFIISIFYLSPVKTISSENYLGLKIMHCDTHLPEEQKRSNIFISLKYRSKQTARFTTNQPTKIKSLT